MDSEVYGPCRFVEAGGKFAGIVRLEDAWAILEGVCGTIGRPTGVSLDFTPEQASAGPRAPATAAQSAPKPQAPGWVPFDLPPTAPIQLPDPVPPQPKPRAPGK